MDAGKVANLLLEAQALKFNVAEPFTYASGIKSPVYMNCRILISDIEKRDVVVDGLVEIISQIDCDIICGTASAGLAWGMWVATKLEKPLIYVSSSKIHGKKPKNMKTLVLEDLVSTGKSSLEAVSALRNGGAEVSDCVSIFSYGLTDSEIAFNGANVILHTLSDFKTAVEVATSAQYLNKVESMEALNWQKDASRWRK